LSAGSDPVADFERFAAEMNMTKKVEKISLDVVKAQRLKL